MATRIERTGVGPGFRLYIGLMILLFFLSYLGLFSIGMLVIPIPLAMMIGLLFWGRPTVVAALVFGLAAGVIGFFGTAPFFCNPEPGVTDCARWFLPSTEGPRTTADWVLAVSTGLVAGVTAAGLGGFTARQLSRWAGPSRG